VRALGLVEAAHGDILVDDIAAGCGVTPRTLHAVFSRELGLAPKQVARVVRVRRALELIRAQGGPIMEISRASAYADPAHLCREFRNLLGMTPRVLSRRIWSGPARSVEYTTERDLLSTGLLLLPRDEGVSAPRRDARREDVEAGPTSR
jgi:AraC-like DNA-binding protein